MACSNDRWGIFHLARMHGKTIHNKWCSLHHIELVVINNGGGGDILLGNQDAHREKYNRVGHLYGIWVWICRGDGMSHINIRVDLIGWICCGRSVSLHNVHIGNGC